MLRFSSCQAEIAEMFCQAVAEYIGGKLSIPWEFVRNIPWQERERLLDQGDIQVCWICGLPYVRKNDEEDKNFELVAAPVMKHPRYGARPVYYSDVIVHADSSFRHFEDLRRGTWAYNEPGPHSGYNLVRYHLAMRGLGQDRYFARIVESGSHQNSLRMVLERAIDAAAIDSTVLDMEFANNPSIIARIRTVSVLGPSPAPPWVVHRSVRSDVRRALRREFVSMDKDPHGRRMLEEAGVLRFSRVSDRDYDPIREMDRIASVSESVPGQPY